MSTLVESLRRDHRNMEQLLLILEQELAVFDRAEAPDFEVIGGIIEYFRSYPSDIHHPKEDLIAERLAALAPERARAIVDIEAEHGQAGRRLERFGKLIDDVVNEQVVAREALDRLAAEFIAHERRHIELEEQQLLPAALEVLSAADWRALDGKLTDRRDPLFDQAVESRFAALADRLARWEREDQAQRDLFEPRTRS